MRRLIARRYLDHEGEVSLNQDLRGGRGRPWEQFFDFYKTRHILLSDGANCIVLRFVVWTQYQRVMDGRTDGWTELP